MLIFKRLTKNSSDTIVHLDVSVVGIDCRVEEELLPSEEGMLRGRDWYLSNASGTRAANTLEMQRPSSRTQHFYAEGLQLGRLNLQFERRGRVTPPKYFIQFEFTARSHEAVLKAINEFRKPVLRGRSGEALASDFFSVSVGRLDNPRLIAMGSLSQFDVNTAASAQDGQFGRGSFLVQDRRLCTPFLEKIK